LPWVIAGVVAAVVIGAFAFGGQGDQPSSRFVPNHSLPSAAPDLTADPPLSTGTRPAPPMTAITGAAPTTESVPITTVTSTDTATTTDTTTTNDTSNTPTTTPTTAPATTTLSLAPIYTNDANLGLFVIGANGDGSPTKRVELATGALRPISANAYSSFDIVGLTGSGTSAQLVTRTDLHSDFAAPCADGTWWIVKPDDRGRLGTLQRERVIPGSDPQVVQTVDIGDKLRVLTFYEIGTTIDCRPLLRGPDSRTYAIDPASGSSTRYAEGLVGNASAGSFVEVQCGEAGTCTAILHGSGGLSLTIPYNIGTRISISPDGTRALVMHTHGGYDFRFGGGGPATFDDVQLADLATGSVTVLDGTAGMANAVEGRTSDLWAAWTPDSKVAVYVGDRYLARIDAASASLSVISISSFDIGGDAIIGIA
jgi:hypothetical protein